MSRFPQNEFCISFSVPPSGLPYSPAEIFEDEIRCYPLPHYIVKREHELLRLHKRDNLPGLINMIHDDLSVIVMLLRHIESSVEVSGLDLHLIGESLARPLKVLDSVCSQLADFELVQTTIAPA